MPVPSRLAFFSWILISVWSSNITYGRNREPVVHFSISIFRFSTQDWLPYADFGVISKVRHCWKVGNWIVTCRNLMLLQWEVVILFKAVTWPRCSYSQLNLQYLNGAVYHEMLQVHTSFWSCLISGNIFFVRFHILAGESRGEVLGNSFNGGQCTTVKRNETRRLYRVPANLEAVSFQVLSSSSSQL